MTRARIQTNGIADAAITTPKLHNDLVIDCGEPLALPSAPTALTATAGNAQVSLSWSAPASNGGIAITDYVVQFSSNDGSTWNTFADGTSTATSATVTGLTNGTAYVFRVAAVNAIGTGAYTAASSSVTPTAAPTLTKLTNGTNGSFTGSGTAADPFVAATYEGGIMSSPTFQVSGNGTINVLYNGISGDSGFRISFFSYPNYSILSGSSASGTNRSHSFSISANTRFVIEVDVNNGYGTATNLRMWATA